MADDAKVTFSINSSILKPSAVAAAARAALGKIVKDGSGALTVFVDTNGVLHVSGSHGESSAPLPETVADIVPLPQGDVASEESAAA